jgi:phthalate 4,5-cis-dihydrodiol dehydrogenase
MLTKFETNNLRIGVIGLGDHAFEQLLPALKITSGLKLTTLSSRTPKKLQTFAQKFQPDFTTSNWRDLIDPGLIDGVIVSAPPQIHYEVAKKCIESGIHCFIEKPPTQNITQLKELVDLTINGKVKTFVGFNFSFSDAYTKLTQILSTHPLKLGKFRFITAKPDSPVDGFATVLESGLYKMFIHPAHTLYHTFGAVEDLDILETVLDKNRFSMVVNFRFKNEARAILDWGNYGNRFECKFELVNQAGETGVLDNMGNYEFWNLQKHVFDKSLKGKERLIYDNSPLIGGYERTGYQRELELWRNAIIQDSKSPSDLTDALEIYKIIEMVKAKSEIGF